MNENFWKGFIKQAGKVPVFSQSKPLVKRIARTRVPSAQPLDRGFMMQPLSNRDLSMKNELLRESIKQPQ